MACRKNTLISQMRKKFLCKKKQKNCVHCCFKMMNLVFYFLEKCNDINVLEMHYSYHQYATFNPSPVNQAQSDKH